MLLDALGTPLSLDHLEEETIELIKTGHILAMRAEQNDVDVIFFLLAILESPETIAARVLMRCGVDLSSLHVSLISALADITLVERSFVPEDDIRLSSEAAYALQLAMDEAMRMPHDPRHQRIVGSGHLLLGIIRTETLSSDLLTRAGGSLVLARQVMGGEPGIVQP